MRNFIDIIGAPETEEEFGGCSCCFTDTDAGIDEAHDSVMNYDPQSKYDEFNQKFFGGELPNIPIEWGNLKNVGGEVTFKFKAKPGAPARLKHQRRDWNHYEMVPNTMKMVISRTLLRDEAALDGIMLHEMIHVYMAAIAGLVGENHGVHFERMRRELSVKSGMNVPLTDNARDAVMNPETKLKEIVVMLFERGGKLSYAILNKNATMKPEVFEALVLDWARRAKHFDATVKFYLVKDPLWTGLLMTGLKEQRGKVKDMYNFRPEIKDGLLDALNKSTLLMSLPVQQ